MGKRKYGNIPTEVNGIIFPSKKEASRYSELKMLLRSGYISDLRWQHPYKIVVNGVLICTYLADFRYLDKDGREVVEDVKSQPTKTAVYRLKAKLMLAVHAIRVIEIQ